MKSPVRKSSSSRHHKKESRRRSRSSSSSSENTRSKQRSAKDSSSNQRRPNRKRSSSASSASSGADRRKNKRRSDRDAESSNHPRKIKRERSRSVSPGAEEFRQRQKRRNDQEREPFNRGQRGDYSSRPGRGDRRGGPRGRGNGRGQNRNDRRGFQGRKGAAEEEDFEWGRQVDREEKPKVEVEKEQPNFGLSGKLTEATNMVNGVVVKYSEPPEARKSTRRWRFYVFKGEETLPTLYIHRQSAYLIGKDRRVADIRLDHPSISAQHAALQYRLVSTKSENGLKSFKAIRPYIIDLESSNGTFLNNKKIEPKRYVELKEKDVLKFGFSSREYVVLHEHSQDDDSGDEIVDEGPNA